MGAVGRHPDEPSYVRSAEFRNTLMTGVVACFCLGLAQSARQAYYPNPEEVRDRIEATQLEVELAKAKAELRQVEREIELAENPPEIKAELEFEEVVVTTRPPTWWSVLFLAVIMVVAMGFSFAFGRFVERFGD